MNDIYGIRNMLLPNANAMRELPSIYGVRDSFRMALPYANARMALPYANAHRALPYANAIKAFSLVIRNF